MRCPRCPDSPLHEVDRSGITIDRCDRCRGIWLDRGELEKLLARGDADDDAARRGRQRDDDDDDDDDDRRGNRGGRRGSFWDIFD